MTKQLTSVTLWEAADQTIEFELARDEQHGVKGVDAMAVLWKDMRWNVWVGFFVWCALIIFLLLGNIKGQSSVEVEAMVLGFFIGFDKEQVPFFY